MAEAPNQENRKGIENLRHNHIHYLYQELDRIKDYASLLLRKLHTEAQNLGSAIQVGITPIPEYDIFLAWHNYPSIKHIYTQIVSTRGLLTEICDIIESITYQIDLFQLFEFNSIEDIKSEIQRFQEIWELLQIS